MAWLREVGIIETNPVALTKFALMWLDNHITINDCVKGFNPIVQDDIVCNNCGGLNQNSTIECVNCGRPI